MNTTTALLKSSSSTRWLARQARDPFVAGRGSYRARSAFKLKDLAKKYPIMGRRIVDLGAAPGGWSEVAAERQRQYRGRGVVVAVDLLPMEPIRGVQIVQGDFFDAGVQSKVLELLRGAGAPKRKVEKEGEGEASTKKREPKIPFGLMSAPEPQTTPEAEAEQTQPETTVESTQGLADCVLSDMMAAMSGIRDRDVQASLDLVGAATWLAHQVLRPKDTEYDGGSLV